MSFNALSINPLSRAQIIVRSCFEFENQAGTTRFNIKSLTSLENGESTDDSSIPFKSKHKLSVTFEEYV